MSIDWNAGQDAAIRAYPHDIDSVEEVIKCSVFVQETPDKAAGVTVAAHRRIERASPGLTDGLCSGYLNYFHEYQGKPLSDQDIYRLFAESLTDERYTPLFNTGWVISFVEALLEDRDVFARQ
jgi:hypothetical protein